MLVDYVINTHQASLHRVCKLMNFSRSVYHYQPLLNDDELIKETLNELVEKYPRYGFKKLFQKTRQRQFSWNHKRVYRIYCELGLNLRRKAKKRLPSRNKITLAAPEQINISWSLDFMSDALLCGRRFRTVNVIDDCNREALRIKASHSLPAVRVTAFLDEIACQRGYPLQLRVDNGPENISKEMVLWAKQHGVYIQYIQPGKPAQNAFIERFNRTYREEVLDMYLFKNIAEVQVITDKWLQEYNNERPHESLGNLTPLGYIKKPLVSTNALY